MKKKAPALAGIIIAVIIFALFYLLYPQGEKAVSGETSTDRTVEAGTITDVKTGSSEMPKSNTGGTKAAAESPIVVPDTEGIIPDGFIHAKVTRIVDGDTIVTEYKNEEYKIRLLCMDTPETVKKGVSVQPYGKQASEKIKKMLLNKKVTLVFEKDVYDNYDRLLAYVILKDSTCVNAFLVEQGYARVDMVRPNTVHRDYFEGLQEDAIRHKRGLWSLPVNKRPFVQNEKGYYVPQYLDDAA
jgi:micrococcal nuclease